MRIRKGIVLLLIFFLTGCALPELPQDTTGLHMETVQTTSGGNHTSEATVPQPTQPAQTETTQAESTAPSVTQPEPGDADFVKVSTYIPDVLTDLRYATEDNFTGQKIYSFTEVYLRYGTVKKLMLVQDELRQNGLRLKIWDGFRPPSAQFALWDICPDPTYVANPNNGFSSHSRGNTVDITVVRSDGTELTMPTGFDDFSKLADRDYSDCGQEAAENAIFLEQLMQKHGFKPYAGEWWHFTDTQAYDVELTFEPVAPYLSRADCSEYISLRTNPDTAAGVITKIPAGGQFTVTAKHGDFLRIEYGTLFGYVLAAYTQPLT